MVSEVSKVSEVSNVFALLCECSLIMAIIAQSTKKVYASALFFFRFNCYSVVSNGFALLCNRSFTLATVVAQKSAIA